MICGSDSDDVNESKCNNVNDARTEYIPRINNIKIRCLGNFNWLPFLIRLCQRIIVWAVLILK